MLGIPASSGASGAADGFAGMSQETTKALLLVVGLKLFKGMALFSIR